MGVNQLPAGETLPGELSDAGSFVKQMLR